MRHHNHLCRAMEDLTKSYGSHQEASEAIEADVTYAGKKERLIKTVRMIDSQGPLYIPRELTSYHG